MELRLCHLYPDLLNLYGDRGNITTLLRRVGVLETPEDDRRADPYHYRMIHGQLCKECGNAAVIKKDGCEFCTACGAIGACG